MMCVWYTHSSWLYADGLFSVNACVRDVATQVAGSDNDGSFEIAHIHDSL